MAVQFSIMGSGSKGNAAVVGIAGAGLLIDLGLGPRTLLERLADAGTGPDRLVAALLTHTHADHVRDASLRLLARKGVPLYCHEGHHRVLDRLPSFARLRDAGLVRSYDERPFLAPAGMRVEPVALSHDGGPTFGFRIEGREGRRGRPVSVGYLADTGCWTEAMADGMADVDVLGVEFNHDVELQRRSGRPPHLIARNLGDGGHLSNGQGAAFVEAVIARSAPGTLRHVVLLHLSERCNRAELAVGAARGAIRGTGRRIDVHVALQWAAFPNLVVTPSRRSRRPAPGATVGFPWEAA